ncbi:oligopeptide/dipeptide ABC transporter ATP-binding protein [Paenibacillus sp. V4I3]|uniref:ABC transporter ATP-binding protein n=1 Tax=unclassified Paenibacillus TaxID=185978 RepID=UPI00278B1AA2|nr:MULTISPECIES: oligopeptide/dipeptide ABC transporter ATP-binding protein [unclassified Paenibacillus]MDQ0877301.1 oligopeptide/dipeptide ABC transporter ATP-binding protein [Paenibacillus sp. V4I3]MDQ0886832.1 oligopeptide/dipeptide ABC transporter ATP-binding protein [Paenibacillus sp. V4I9]
MSKPILKVNNLNKDFQVKSKNKMFSKPSSIRVLNNVSFELLEGETLSIVGESGCGKTTLGRCIVRGMDATSGQVMYQPEGEDQVDFLGLRGKEFKKYRKDIQMIFQDPYSSLSPRMSVYDIIAEPLLANFKLSKAQLDDKVTQIAEKTGLNVSYLKRYPHAFSGGQRQRIAIARSLISQPRLIVCDEAVSALDVSIKAQIINLLKDLQEQLQITYIFISHDLSIVQNISDRVAVMHLGKIVELAPVDSLFDHPKHPYTEALLSAVPEPDPNYKKDRIILEGEVPNPANPPSGCHFHPRCTYKTDKCIQEEPEMQAVGENHYAACHYASQLNLRGVIHE